MGELLVVSGATLACTFGAAPSTLAVIPAGTPVAAGGPMAATIMDQKPIVNIAPFGMCSAPTNPAVMAATSAAMGVLTPMPCVPLIPAPWAPGSTVTMIGGQPALTQPSLCLCTWLGQISITNPGQQKVTG